MNCAWLKDLRMADLAQVGGKNASLGEMIGGLSAAGVRVPGGFATTAQAFEAFLAGGLGKRIAERIKGLDPRKVASAGGVRGMVRSARAGGGWMFRLGTGSGFRDVVFIPSAGGGGEMVVRGAVNPDDFYVHKPMLAAGKPAILRRRLG